MTLAFCDTMGREKLIRNVMRMCCWTGESKLKISPGISCVDLLLWIVLSVTKKGERMIHSKNSDANQPPFGNTLQPPSFELPFTVKKHLQFRNTVDDTK